MELFYSYLAKVGSGRVVIPDDIVVSVDKLKRMYIKKSDRFCSEVESDLLDKFCSVIWPSSVNDKSITLHCTLTQETVESRSQVSEWTEECTAILDQSLANIISGTEKNVSLEIWQEFMLQLKKDASRELEELYTEEDKENSQFTYVGTVEMVKKFQSIALKLKTQLMEELTRKKNKKFEVVSTLTPPQLQIVERSKFWESLPGDLVVSVDQNGISFEGTESQISDAKLNMYQNVVTRIKEQSRPLDTYKLKLLQRQETEEYFQNVFVTKGWNVAWTIGSDSITVHSTDGGIISKVISAFDNDLVQKNIALDSARAAALALPEWKDIEQDLADKYKILDIVVASDKSNVTCCSIRDDIDMICSKINGYLQDNQSVEQFIPVPKEKVAYLQRHLQNEIQQTVANLPAGAVKFEPNEDEKKSGFLVRGIQQAVKELAERICSLAKDVSEVVHDSEVPGIYKYCSSQRGSESIKEIENKKRVIVSVTTEVTEAAAASGGGGGAGGGSCARAHQGSTKKLSHFVLNNCATISVAKGNITDYQAEAIVVPIESDLRHSRGTAKAVADIGMYELLLVVVVVFQSAVNSQ